ncbi:MAG: hypothetical protein A2W00_13285 [Candidatus Eisenbacteria bacterium RBG_16_71_46]|nr:MAG: hypothetical protein A2W00_13285 [Candidatus Eisenbacteria bacterium RBG_16_71_46]
MLRYPNVYGPRQNPHGEAGVNAIFIGLMLHGRRPRIFGDGEQVRDYLYVGKLLHGLDYTVLRYPNVYGPRQNPHGEAGVNAIFIGLMLHGRRPRIFGDGEQVRDYLYVGDVVEANLLALGRGSGEIVNLGTGVGTSVNDIVRELKRILGFEAEAIYDAPRPGEVRRIYLDASRAKRVLGWEPRTPFAQGLEQTVAWSREAGV